MMTAIKFGEKKSFKMAEKIVAKYKTKIQKMKR